MQETQAAPVIEAVKAPAAAATAPKRYVALDAYRGFIMFVLVSGGFGLRALARNRPDFAWIATQFDHKPWEWIAFWDLIQPAFMFMVGVAMPFALAIRRARSQLQRRPPRLSALRKPQGQLRYPRRALGPAPHHRRHVLQREIGRAHV